MNKKTKIIIGVINFVATLLLILGLAFLLTELEKPIKILLYIAIPIIAIGVFVLIALNKEKLCKSLFIIYMLVFVVLAVFFILNLTGLFSSLSDMNKIKDMIVGSGGFGIALCFLLIIANVVILPAPSVVFYLAITAVYGSWLSFVICYVATVLGSIIAFTIGRKFGKKAVVWCIGKEDTEKYSNLLSKKGKVPFLVMQLLPFFPDDILCMVAGLSNMSYKFLILSMIFIRPIYIAFVCFLGTGEIIPFSGWGIAVWIASLP